ncbi:MAG: hypothetical protein ACOZBX_05610 [Campylobacterota bacterium]
MAYLLWFGIVALAFAWMHYFTELSGRQKGIISGIITLLIAAAVAYNVRSDRERDRITAVELKYRSGQTLVCDGVEVNASTFDYSVGTQSFIGLKGTPHYQRIFNARECE